MLTSVFWQLKLPDRDCACASMNWLLLQPGNWRDSQYSRDGACPNHLDLRFVDASVSNPLVFRS